MPISISLDYGLTLLAALLIGMGFVLQQQTAQLEPASRFLSLRLLTDLVRQPRWLVGIGCMIGGQFLAAWSIGNLSLASVEPLLTTNLVFALVLAVPIAKATLRLWEFCGAAVLCTGVALLSAARSAKPIGLSFGSVSHWPAAALIAALAFAVVYQGRQHSSRVRATLTGVGAGLVFGIQDALTRQTLQILSSSGVGAMFSTWAPYALVGAGAIGLWLMQSAFSAGPLQLSLPAIAAGEPLIGILLGVLIFGDRIQVSPGELALQAAGVVAMLAGVIMVARAPALSQLPGWTPHGLPHITGGFHVPGHLGRQATGDEPQGTAVAQPSAPGRPGDGHQPGDGQLGDGQPADGHQPGDGEAARLNGSGGRDPRSNGQSPGKPRQAGEPGKADEAASRSPTDRRRLPVTEGRRNAGRLTSGRAVPRGAVLPVRRLSGAGAPGPYVETSRCVELPHAWRVLCFHVTRNIHVNRPGGARQPLAAARIPRGHRAFVKYLT